MNEENCIVKSADRKSLFDQNGKLKKIEGQRKKKSEWWIQGFQLNKCYIEHWDEIKKIFKQYGVDLNRQGPVLTIQTLKQVRIAKELTEILKNDPEIRRIASRCDFPIRTVIYTTKLNEEKLIDGIIFVTLLRIIPEFCLNMGIYHLENFLSKKDSYSHLKKVFSTQGTVLETDESIVQIVKSMIKEIEKELP